MATEARRDVFQAIADPNRREMINLIARQSMNLNAIAQKFEISRPAVSQHIKILMECGLVVMVQKGRERYCEAKLDQLLEVSSWVEQYKQFWTTNFSSLEKYLNKTQNIKKDGKRSKKK